MKLVAMTLLLAAGTASAEEGFGSKGTISPGGSIGLSYFASGGPKDVFVSLNPEMLVFVADGLAVGGAIQIAFTSASSTITYGLAPTIGWNLWLGDRVSIFPRASLRSTWVSDTGRPVIVTAQAFAPFLLHVAPHFFLGFGPFFSRDLYTN